MSFFPNFNTKFPNPASKIKVASETSACEILLILRQNKREYFVVTSYEGTF